MKIISKITFLLLLFVNLNAQETYKFESRFGFLEGGTILSSFQDARVALKVWLEDIAKNYNGKMEASFYKTEEELFTDYKNGKLDMIVLTPPFYFKNEKEIKKVSDNYWSLSISNSNYVTYYLLGSIKNKSTSFKNLKKGSVSIRAVDEVSRIWLEKNIYEAFDKPMYHKIKDLHYTEKESTALLNVFFNKKDYAVVSKNTWDTMIELNPSIKKRVKIIESSKAIHFPLIGMFSKDANNESIKAFFDLSENLKDLDGSEQIFDLLKFNGIFKIDNESMEELREYYNVYYDLKKRYD